MTGSSWTGEGGRSYNGREPPAQAISFGMHDLKLIRDDPQGFDRALGRRGLQPVSASILEIDREPRQRSRTGRTRPPTRSCAESGRLATIRSSQNRMTRSAPPSA